MNTVKMIDLVRRCNRLKNFRDDCKNIPEAQLSITNGNAVCMLESIDTAGLIDQVRDIVRTRIDTLEFQIKQLVNDEKST